MGLVDVQLYEFLRKNENHLYLDKDTNVCAFTVIHFSDLKKFIEILREEVGGDYFTERRECLLHDGYITMDLKELITEYLEQNISDYKKIFDKDDWEKYKNELLRQEKG